MTRLPVNGVWKEVELLLVERRGRVAIPLLPHLTLSFRTQSFNTRTKALRSHCLFFAEGPTTLGTNRK